MSNKTYLQAGRELREMARHDEGVLSGWINWLESAGDELLEVAEAATEWRRAEFAAAVESLPYLGLGPDEVFERRDRARIGLQRALDGLEAARV